MRERCNSAYVCTSVSFKVTFRSRRQNVASPEECEIISRRSAAHRNANGLEDAARDTGGLHQKKKEGGKKEKKKKHARDGYSHGYSLNDSTMLGHSSKRHNTSSMTGNAQFR